MLRKGRWYWEPPARLRASHGLKVASLGPDAPIAWAMARQLNQQFAGLPSAAKTPGTVEWMFEQFFEGEKFDTLAANTQRDYRWLAKRLCGLEIAGNRLGSLPARSVKARHADKLYATLVKDGATAAHYACRFARRVWKWAGRRDLVDAHPNPWSGMELPTLKPRQQRWTRAQVLAVVEKAAEMGAPSIGLAVLIAYEFGHRQGDVLGLTWAAVDTGSRQTSKTGVMVPLVPASYPEVAAALAVARAARAAVPSTHLIICETTGLPWGADHFRHEFRAVADAAGIPSTLQFRDLRATAATELADAGADLIEMSTHTGHLTTQMARRYARRTTAQFESAAAKRIKARGEREGNG